MDRIVNIDNYNLLYPKVAKRLYKQRFSPQTQNDSYVSDRGIS